MAATVTVYHDVRRKKANGLYPVKLQVFHNYERRYYWIVDLRKVDFEAAMKAGSKLLKHKDNRQTILLIETKAKTIVEDLVPFTWDKFEKRLLRPTASIGNVFYYYDTITAKMGEDERIGTKTNYEDSKKSIVKYLESKGREAGFLSFESVDEDFLKSYEKWMLKKGNSISSVGFYLRPLRAIFNAAIDAGEVPQSIYPFKKGVYQIPAANNVKKALGMEDLKKLYKLKTADENMIKARAFWFFSYLCNGINIKDVCELKYKNVHKDKITFIRAKTQATTKGNQKTIVAATQPLIQEVILRYGNEKHSPETYVFPVLNPSMKAQAKHTAILNFIRYINQHIKRLAKLAGIDETISTYFARHSFSTISVRGGASVEFVQKSLGHSNIKTTENYLASLDHEAIKKNAEKLMDW